MDVVGRLLAIAVAVLVLGGCPGASSSESPRRLRTVASKLRLRPPLVLVPDSVPGVPLALELPPTPDRGDSSGGTAEPEPRDPKELRRKSFDSLPRPLYLDSHRSGNCGGTLAVDGVGRIWSESGCEHTSTGVVSTERLSAKQKRHFDAALVKLRRLPGITKSPPCTFPSSIMLLERSGHERSWRFCPARVPEEIEVVRSAMRDSPEP